MDGPSIKERENVIMTDTEQVTLFQQDTEADNGEKRENGASKGSGRGSRRAKEPLTSKQQLNSTIKSVRDLLRKPRLTTDTNLCSKRPF